MALESTLKRRPVDAPRDKPHVDRVEHANLDRPGANLHPRASQIGWEAPFRGRGWDERPMGTQGWRLH
jgi:hypothetical protein